MISSVIGQFNAVKTKNLQRNLNATPVSRLNQLTSDTVSFRGTYGTPSFNFKTFLSDETEITQRITTELDKEPTPVFSHKRSNYWVFDIDGKKIGVKHPINPNAEQDTIASLSEAFTLKYLNSKGVKHVPKLYGYATRTDREKENNYLFVEHMEGKKFGVTDITPEKLQDLFSIFRELDEVGVLNYDLHEGNILVDENAEEKINLIDFGGAELLANIGQYIFLPESHPFLFDSQIDKMQQNFDTRVGNVKFATQSRFEHVPEYAYYWNFVDNPYLKVSSNIINFEFRCLSRALTSLEDRGEVVQAHDCMRTYLKEKSNYHRANADYIEITIQPKNEEDEIKKRKAIQHELATARLFENPPNIVVQIERDKMRYKEFHFEYAVGNQKDINFVKAYLSHKRLLTNLEKASELDGDIGLYAQNLQKTHRLFNNGELKLQ